MIGDDSIRTLAQIVVKHAGNDFTLTDKHGNALDFNTSGLLTTREDPNGNTITYAYSGSLLSSVTDPFSSVTNFTYTGDQLTSVSDFAIRSGTLTYDASGRLTKVTQPDADGAGTLEAPVWDFTYDATSDQLTKVTNPLDDDTTFTYGSHDRLIKVTHPDLNDWHLTSLRPRACRPAAVATVSRAPPRKVR